MECIQATQAEIDDLIAHGWVVVGGPYQTVNDCVANCGQSNSSNSSTSTNCCPLCQKVPVSWTVGIAGGTGVYSILNGSFNNAVIDGYSACNATDPATWIINLGPDSNGNTAYIIFGPDGAGGFFGYCDILNSSNQVIADVQWHLSGTGCTSICCGTHSVPLNSYFLVPPNTGTPPSNITLTGNC